MNTSKLSNFVWAFFALVLTTTTVFGQGYRNRNNAFNNQNQFCLNQISDLTDEQKAKIGELEKSHKKEMTSLRLERQSTTDVIEKNEIRGTMLKTVKAHRETVRNLLTEDQQKQFDLIHANGSNYGNRNGNGNFQGRQQFRRQLMFAGNCGNCCRGNWAGRQGNGRGNRQFKGCYRNFNQNN